MDTNLSKDYEEKAMNYLQTLCAVQPNRRTGSPGNRKATEYFSRIVGDLGYTPDTTSFPCYDFVSKGASILCDTASFDVFTSPFSAGCNTTADLTVVSTIDELIQSECKGKLLLLKGAITSEPLMPKNFVFYNPDHHKKIYALLERKQPAAIITATSKNPGLVGAEYPFAMIEDGDFDIPSVYCTEKTGEAISVYSGKHCRIISTAKRIPAKANNVIVRQNPNAKKKIVVCAHIDARANTPGATDDAAGTVVLLLLAEMITSIKKPLHIEIVAFNGEDYYSAGGQMDYLQRYGKELKDVVLAINIDDVGYMHGKTAYSFYEFPNEMTQKINPTFTHYKGLLEGLQWYQGDHMIFAQKGIPSIAFATDKMEELMTEVTHTPRDTPDIVDCNKLVEIAQALTDMIHGW